MFSKWRERGETENEGEEEEEEEEEEEARGHCFEIRGTRSKRCPPPDKRYGKIFTTDGLANDFVTVCVLSRQKHVSGRQKSRKSSKLQFLVV